MPPANKTNRRKGGETAFRVLLFDVESSPNIGFTWGRYEQDVIKFVKERQIISFAWKWLGDSEVHALSLPDFKGYRPMFQDFTRNRNDNMALMRRLHALISKADIAIGHNIDGFDDKRANTDFILNGFNPPPPHKTIDTLKVVRRKFQFNSNKLGDLGERLGLGSKVHNPGFKMWLGCMNGNKKDWDNMVRYNKGDVVLLEKIYLKVRPWMTNHPDMNGITNRIGCPTCRSTNIGTRGWVFFAEGRRRRYVCNSCGLWLPSVLCRKLANLRDNK